MANDLRGASAHQRLEDVVDRPDAQLRVQRHEGLAYMIKDGVLAGLVGGLVVVLCGVRTILPPGRIVIGGYQDDTGAAVVGDDDRTAQGAILPLAEVPADLAGRDDCRFPVAVVHRASGFADFARICAVFGKARPQAQLWLGLTLALLRGGMQPVSRLKSR